MTIAERVVGNVTILDLEGKLTLGDGAPEFRKAVDALVAASRVARASIASTPSAAIRSTGTDSSARPARCSASVASSAP